MSKIFHRQWNDLRSEILSLTIFKLDVLESFKYRKKQTWFFLFFCLTLFSLISWGFFIEASRFNWSNGRVFLLILLYLPLLITLLFWFRACSIYDFSSLKPAEDKLVITKKQARASLIIRISLVSFSLYYGYWMYRLAHIVQ